MIFIYLFLRSGKTEIIKQILRNKDRLFSEPITAVYFCYGMWQPQYEQDNAFKNVVFIEGLITEEHLNKLTEKHENNAFLIICDDLMLESVNSHLISQILIKYSHHKKICFIYTAQQLFPPGRYGRTIATSLTNIVLCRINRDVSQLTHLSYQMYGKSKHKEFMEIYYDAVDGNLNISPVTYLMIHCHPLYQNRQYRLFTNCFRPLEEYPVVYKL